MRFLLAALLMAGLLAAPTLARANCTSVKIGNIIHHTCGNRTGVSILNGGTAFHQFGNRSGVSFSGGGTSIHQFGGRTAATPDFRNMNTFLRSYFFGRLFGK